MNLYRTQLFSPDWGRGRTPTRTAYRTSLADAKSALKREKGEWIVVHSCQVPDRLTTEQWAHLLESDAPGRQTYLLSVTELATDYAEVYTSKR